MRAVLCAKNFWYAKFIKDRENVSLKNEYHFWRNFCSNLKNKLKKKYFSDKFVDSQNSIKRTWNCIYDVIYNGEPPKKQSKFLQSYTDKQLAIDQLNDHFCEKKISIQTSI